MFGNLSMTSNKGPFSDILLKQRFVHFVFMLISSSPQMLILSSDNITCKQIQLHMLPNFAVRIYDKNTCERCKMQ